MINLLPHSRPIDVENTTELGKTEFNELYGFPGKAVKFTSLMDTWEAKKLWNLEFFRDYCGDVKEEVGEGPEHMQECFLRDYCEAIKNGCSDPRDYFKTQFHITSALRHHYRAPEIFNCWYSSLPLSRRKYILSWIYVGGAGSFSRMHRDVWNTSAWNALTQGKKLWYFFDAAEEDCLYQGEVDPFRPDYEKFPLFKDASPEYCIQEPGEIVFTPSNCWHSVFNLLPSVAVTENFINETNYQNVLRYFKEAGNTAAFNSILQLAESQNEIHDIS